MTTSADAAHSFQTPRKPHRMCRNIYTYITKPRTLLHFFFSTHFPIRTTAALDSPLQFLPQFARKSPATKLTLFNLPYITMRIINKKMALCMYIFIFSIFVYMWMYVKIYSRKYFFWKLEIQRCVIFIYMNIRYISVYEDNVKVRLKNVWYAMYWYLYTYKVQ